MLEGNLPFEKCFHNRKGKSEDTDRTDRDQKELPEGLNMPQFFGTLEYTTQSQVKEKTAFRFTEDGRKEWTTEEYRQRQGLWRVNGAQPAIMMSRIIPNCWTKEPGVVEVKDNIANIEHLRWIMLRYPLEILDEKKWNARVLELEQILYRRYDNGKRNLKADKAEPSSSFVGELRDFQKEGLDFLLRNNGTVLLADSMGTGKTIEALSFMVTANKALPALIVAPLVTLQNWKREIEKFVRIEGDVPSINVIRDGSPNDLEQADFYVINYDLVAKRKEDLFNIQPRTICLDEVQNIRNANTERYAGIKEIAAARSVTYRCGLSGTPIYNHGYEIWPIIDFIYPGLLGTRQEFTEMYCNKYDSREIAEDKRQALYEFLCQNVMIRRRKEDVLKDLPEKTRYHQEIEVDLAFYDNEMDKLIEELNRKLGDANTDLKKIAQAYSGFNASERQIAGVSKVPAVISFVKDMMELEESIVVFCHHHVVHDLLMSSFAEFKPSHIIGGQPDAARQVNIDRFQNSETKLMIAGLRAGNVGINLTAGSYVVFAELDWSPAIHLQAEDRCHRIGTKHPVFAYYLEGLETFDTTIGEILTEKTMEIESVMGDTRTEQEGEQNQKRAEQILEMIRKRLEKRGRKLEVIIPDKNKILEERNLASS